MKKYELIKQESGFFRIKALREFGDVKKGELGGFVQGESNLSNFGNSWIYGNAKVYGNARICDNAKVYGNAEVCDNAIVCDNAEVYGDTKIFDNTKIYGNMKIGNVNKFTTSLFDGLFEFLDNVIKELKRRM